MDNNKVAIVPLGDESREVNQILANDTARKILNLISDEPLSAMPIAYKLNLAINTAQYNLEKLKAVGLIEVVRVDKSKKGRDVKIYGPTNKIIAIIPKNVNSAGIYDALRGLVPLFIIALLLSVGVDIFMYSPEHVIPTVADGELGRTYNIEATQTEERQNAETTGIMLVYAEKNNTKTAAGGVADTAMESSAGGSVAEPEVYEPDVVVITEPQTPKQYDIFDHPGFWIFVGALGIILFLVLEQKRKSPQ